MIGEKKTPESDSRVFADHAGASPVASALGIRSGATPHGPIHPSTPTSSQPSQPDVSTLLALGRFYFAATGNLSVVSLSDRSLAWSSM